MSLKDTVTEDMKAAMRAKDSARLGTVRLLLAAIKQKEVDERMVLTGTALSDADVLAIIDKMVKQRRESIELYRKGHREDLAAAEEAELKVLESYLPQALTPEELRARVAEAIQAVGATSVKEMGKVMSALMPQVQGRADCKVVSEMVREALGKG